MKQQQQQQKDIVLEMTKVIHPEMIIVFYSSEKRKLT